MNSLEGLRVHLDASDKRMQVEFQEQFDTFCARLGDLLSGANQSAFAPLRDRIYSMLQNSLNAYIMQAAERINYEVAGEHAPIIKLLTKHVEMVRKIIEQTHTVRGFQSMGNPPFRPDGAKKNDTSGRRIATLDLNADLSQDSRSISSLNVSADLISGDGSYLPIRPNSQSTKMAISSENDRPEPQSGNMATSSEKNCSESKPLKKIRDFFPWCRSTE